MESDLIAARDHLRLAYDAHGGKDEISREMRRAIAMLLDAAAHAEHTRLMAKVRLNKHSPSICRGSGTDSLSAGKAAGATSPNGPASTNAPKLQGNQPEPDGLEQAEEHIEEGREAVGQQ